MIFQAGFSHFLEEIFYIIIIFYIIRFVSRLYNEYQYSKNQRNKGNEVHFSPKKEDNEKHISSDAGEYVDYEEIDDGKKE